MNTFLQIKDNIVDFILQLKPTGAEQWLLGIGAAVGFVVSVAVGGFDEMIYALMALMAVDYVTGTIAACKTGHWHIHLTLLWEVIQHGKWLYVRMR